MTARKRPACCGRCGKVSHEDDRELERRLAARQEGDPIINEALIRKLWDPVTYRPRTPPVVGRYINRYEERAESFLKTLEVNMSSFTTPLIVTPLDDGQTWKLLQPFTYEIGEEGSGRKVTVPAEFVTDFASVPRILWTLIPPWGGYGKAAVLHDFLYDAAPWSRSECDSVFLEAMKVLKVPFHRRMAIYLGVRAGGWLAWRTRREEDEPKKDAAGQKIDVLPGFENLPPNP